MKHLRCQELTTAAREMLERKYSPEEIEREYARVSWVYDLWARLTESKAVKRARELAHIRDGESVLEVAVGTGIAFEGTFKLNEHGRNEGIDISPAMLSAASRRMRRYDAGHYHLALGNAYSLPFDDGEFNLVTNNYMIDLLPEQDFIRVLSEFKRTLRPAGRAVIVTMAAEGKWYNHTWQWVAKYYPSLLAYCRPVFIEKHLQESGFTNVKTEFVSQNTVPSQIVTANRP